MDLYGSAANATSPNPSGSGELPIYVGYIGCLLAALLFGSNFIPVKKFETGDGVFFQLILCIAIWLPSVILNAIRGFPRFWPFAMLGGFIWCTGNMMVVPIIQCVGMAMGILMWGTMNLITGWASGRFGWFGLDPEIPDNTLLNYFGVCTCVLSGVMVALIKPHVGNPDDSSASSQQVLVNERESLIPPFSGDPFSVNDEPPAYGSVSDAKENSGRVRARSAPEDPVDHTNPLIRRLSTFQRKILGVILCILSGFLYGLNFAPVIYIKDNYPKWYGNCTADPCLVEPSSKDIDYVFAHFTGILVTSVLYFTIYCIVKKNKPVVYPQVILPALASGLLWSIADIGFFLANEVLDESVSFPIINAGPGIVASMWGVLLFKEIQGRKNLILLAIAFCLTIGGCVLCGLSK
ncbi:transmembrane protein 144-like [Watersipora subatra]|uniref:transmembrane protein 144-like n=1 Tax=Watersipora subatra TaxID=2589382 RepID=UPI00355B09B8